jgi:hypothetical protein
MKTIRPILLIILSFITLQVSAQLRVHLGATTAFNSTFVLDEGLSKDPRYNARMTYNWAPAGVAFGADFNRGFGLQLESFLSNQGQIYEILDIAKQKIGERRIDLQYVTLPLMLNFLSNSSSRASFNFMLGPQLSLLTQGQEIYEQYKAGTLTIPESGQVPAGATDNGNGTYNFPAGTTILASSDAASSIKQFRDKELQIAAGLGLNIDIGSHLYLSTNIRGSYSFTDMRNEDLLNSIQQNSVNDVLKDLAGRRANMLLGAQIGLHFMFGGNRTAVRSLGPLGN